MSNLVVFFFLTKLVTPQEVGVVAIIDLFLGFGLRVFSTGITEPLVQLKHLERKHIDTLFWSIHFMGWIVCVGLVLGSSAITRFFGIENSSGMLAISSLALFLQAMVLVPQALLAREMRFDSIARASIHSDWIAGICCVGAAIAGAGIWAMILQRLLQAFFFFVFIGIASGFHPLLQWSRSHFRQVIGFSTSRLLDNLVLYCDQSAPRFLLGYFVGPSSLGYFSFAKSITDSVLKSTTVPIRTLAMSTLSRVQADLPRVRSIYAQGLSFTSGVLFPSCIGICCIASDIPEVFGSKWSDSVLLVELISIATFRNAFQVWNSAILRSMGFPRVLLILTTLRALASFLLSALLLGFGAIGVCAGILISGLLTSPIAMGVTRKTLGISWADQIKPAISPLIGSIIMGIVLFMIRHCFLQFVPTYYRIGLSVFLGVCLYIVAIFILDRATLRTWLHYFKILGRNRKST